MPDGGIIDVSTGAAQAVGRYFSVISVIPSSLYVVFVYILIASGSWRHSPNWSHAFTSLGHLGVGGIAVFALFSIGLGVAIHPIQFAVVQFFEGYWGTGRIAQAVRSQRILRYQSICEELENKRDSANDHLADLDAYDKMSPAFQAPFRSRRDEARRIRNTTFPRALNQVMPTRLGNVLRRTESLAGSQYGMNALQVVPLLLLIAPASHADYVNDQRTQLDLAVRMTFISAAAFATAILFLWPYGLWVLVAIFPYALAYLSYRGSVVAGRHYGSALDTLINLDRFALYKQLHLQLPATTKEERVTNTKMDNLFNYSKTEFIEYEHPVDGDGTEAASQ
jgi:hypothetical protein